MPIEIRQLVIRATVTAAREPDAGARAAAPARAATSTMVGPTRPSLSREERAELVSACVREVLRRMERSRER